MRFELAQENNGLRNDVDMVISGPRMTGALGCPARGALSAEAGALVAFLSPKLEKARDTSKVPC